jgi:AcrR family transcriptional regulator
LTEWSKYRIYDRERLKMSAETTENRPRRRKEERPDEILAAALAVFTQEGFAGARLDKIADRAGCTKGTIYVYFPSKEELFKAVVRKLIAPEFRQVDNVLQDESLDTATRIKLFVTRAYRQVIEGTKNKDMLRLLIADGPKFPDLVDFYHSEVPRVGFDIMKATLERGIAAGEIRPIDTDLAPLVVFGPIVSETMRRLLGAHRKVDMDKMIEMHLDMLFNGILAKPQKV